jgi:UDP-N-acetylmuramoyl-L-alanyl-D-glutamate--2,6-diaminopimelate ligase
MSLKYKIEPPKTSIYEVLNSLRKESLLIKNDSSISKNDQFLEIFINSKELDKFIENNNEYKKNSFIYIARVGAKFDGHILAEKVLFSGNFFIGKPENIKLIANKNKYPNEWFLKIISHQNFISVNDIEKSINILLEESFKINNDQFNTIAVTGTNGKTSVVQICSQILELLTKEKNVRIGTLGIQIGEETLDVSHVTTPDYPSLLHILNLSQKNNIQRVIMEATSHGLIENRLGNWKIDTAIFTNLTQDHLDYHGTMENYREAKLKLFSHYLKEDGYAIICTNNLDWEMFVKSASGTKRKLIGVGYEKCSEYFLKTYHFYFESIYYLSITDQRSSLLGVSGTIKLQNQSKNLEKTIFNAPLIGDFQFDNLLCSIGAILCEGYSVNEISKKLINIKNIPGRLEIINANKNQNSKFPTVLVDYAHSPDALEKAIQVCKNVLYHEGRGKLITVFGCGGERDKSKRPIMGKIASTLSDEVIVTSDNPRREEPSKIIDDIFSGIPCNNKCLREIDRKKAIELAIHSGKQFDLILVAGKGHEDYQIIGETKFPFSDAQIALSALREEN